MSQQESNEIIENNNKDEDSEKLVDNITSKMPPNMLICPYCVEEYLFEFTMKHHLLKNHMQQIMNNWPKLNYFCPYCPAFFYFKALIVKHISFAHSKNELDDYYSKNSDQKFKIDKENDMEPSNLNQLDCSPGLSAIFNEMDTCDSVKKIRRNDNTIIATPRSILKKTPFSGKIVILSPQSAQSVALKRTINNLKRTASARRELRFDLPPLQPSPEARVESLPPLNFNSPQKKDISKSFWRFLTRRSKSPPSFNRKMRKNIREKACKMSNLSANHIITSTPRHAYDSFDDSDVGCAELENSIGSNWKSAMKTNDFRPLFLTAERYQCNYCNLKFDSNYELLSHQKDNHNKWILFRPAFRCGTCGTKFFRNSLLIRHCHHQHTPLKQKN
jgi:hypothetical protein